MKAEEADEPEKKEEKKKPLVRLKVDPDLGETLSLKVKELPAHLRYRKQNAKDEESRIRFAFLHEVKRWQIKGYSPPKSILSNKLQVSVEDLEEWRRLYKKGGINLLVSGFGKGTLPIGLTNDRLLGQRIQKYLDRAYIKKKTMDKKQKVSFTGCYQVLMSYYPDAKIGEADLFQVLRNHVKLRKLLQNFEEY